MLSMLRRHVGVRGGHVRNANKRASAIVCLVFSCRDFKRALNSSGEDVLDGSEATRLVLLGGPDSALSMLHRHDQARG